MATPQDKLGGSLGSGTTTLLNTIISKYSDIVLAALVIVVVSIIVIPMPTWLVDILLTVQITMWVVILLVALYINEALRIASFPTILLLATLYRLAPNVSTTRLILSDGDAGKVIEAFGH